MNRPNALTEEIKLREYQLPRRVGIGVRTIQRRRLTGEFPPPDYIETAGKKSWGIWFGSTIEKYLEKKVVRVEATR